MKLLRISEFQRLSGLSDRALAWLVVNNRLPCQADPKQGIMVDVESVEIGTLVSAIAARKEELLKERHSFLAERFANIIGKSLEEILDEALAAVMTSQ